MRPCAGRSQLSAICRPSLFVCRLSATHAAHVRGNLVPTELRPLVGIARDATGSDLRVQRMNRGAPADIVIFAVWTSENEADGERRTGTVPWKSLNDRVLRQ